MAMSHELCTHPRTPAGRAACRKAGGPGAAATVTRDTELMSDAKIEAYAKKHHTDAATMKAARDAVKAETPAAPRQVAVKVVTTPAAPNTTPRAFTTGSDILAGLPGVFRAAADWARANACLVTTSTVKDQRMVHLTNAVGRVTLTWRPATPEGVWAVAFKPDASSITTKMTTVNDALAKLKG